ncbi:unknown [Ruminococcus sp. CAG:353]|nr:unknown [Ruminococcus sp. CAG:353]
MYHSAALCHAAQMTNLAADIKLNGIFFLDCISGHYCGSRFNIACVGKLLHQLWNCLNDRLNGQHLTDNACGSNDDLFGLYSQSIGSKAAHFLSLFLAVGIAGVGILGVNDNCLCLSA